MLLFGLSIFTVRYALGVVFGVAPALKADPVWIGPYGRPDAVARVELPCSPCYLRRLVRCGHGHACMESVTADMVIERVERALATADRSAA